MADPRATNTDAPDPNPKATGSVREETITGGRGDLRQRLRKLTRPTAFDRFCTEATHDRLVACAGRLLAAARVPTPGRRRPTAKNARRPVLTHYSRGDERCVR